MTELQIGDQTIRYDREATAAIYATIQHGDAEECGCPACRNFAAQRESIYPASFRAMLELLGIDADKESATAEYGPLADETYRYDGWFALVGEVVAAGASNSHAPDANYFEFFFTRVCPNAPPFTNQPLLGLEFVTNVKWVLKDPPEYRTADGDVIPQ